jgi:hypothetical protein
VETSGDEGVWMVDQAITVAKQFHPFFRSSFLRVVHPQTHLIHLLRVDRHFDIASTVTGSMSVTDEGAIVRRLSRQIFSVRENRSMISSYDKP